MNWVYIATEFGFLDPIHFQFPRRQKMSHCHHPGRSGLQCRRYRNHSICKIDCEIPSIVALYSSFACTRMCKWMHLFRNQINCIF